MRIAIIGGGASGMAAALAASENPHADILLLERQARVGRKLLATGNGRCNLTNLYISPDHYHGEDPKFAWQVISTFSQEDAMKRFRDLGLYLTVEPSGRVYPYSEQANSVVDVLRFALCRKNIQVVTGQEVKRIRKQQGGFRIDCEEKSRFFDKVIVACGGLAGTKLGGSLSGYRLLRDMGHGVTGLRPALVQLKSDWGACPSLKGVRANCHVQILNDGTLHRQSTGEVQFTQYGVSGPAIFEVSRDACQGTGAWLCRMDFVPELSLDDLMTVLERRKATDLPAQELLTGVLHNRLGRVLTAQSGISLTQPIRELTHEELEMVCRTVKTLTISLTQPMGMDAAQVTAGGVRTAEFDPSTMESRLVPGLYACGEVLDVDGDCGGYNLQWAWSSGYVAGHSAGEVSP